MAKIKPYSGNKPYIFISYAHKNTKEVMPIIERMISDGYRVWYDEGIDPGTEWDAFIASKVMGCHCMIAMISDEYIKSENCCDELNFARDENKDRILVYLSDVILPDGMRMRLNRLQAIHKYNYSDDAEFYDKLYKTDMFVLCNPSKSNTGDIKDDPRIISDFRKETQNFTVRFSWPAGAVWSLGGVMLIKVDNESTPLELRNGRSVEVSLPEGDHKFNVCARGYKVGRNISYHLNENVTFICKPSNEAVTWGFFTSAPSVTVTREV